MRHKFSSIFPVFFLFFLFLNMCSVATAVTVNYTSAVGDWTTIDDKTGQALSIVKIYQNTDKGTLEGKVIQINPVLGQKVDDRCQACDGNTKNQPILGMQILWDMQQDKDDMTVWNNGRVLDPKSGSIYRAKMTLINNGCQLSLRGYVMVTWLGRSEVWQRANSECK